jgi:hypothetical protein
LWINDATGLAFRVIVLMAGHGPKKTTNPVSTKGTVIKLYSAAAAKF